ncbi:MULTISPECIES: hypothetical protein [unclassified Moorena]|uniref:hypothetical protein n=1 Tax=unclassified Moorena TaxID=2683338 RepID=UPI0014001395|nr:MULTISPECIES: hypothetical protein [unclassified Moorena]NEO15330.1 hypothetical protein [Moorena sp. SIO3E8]NEQ01731.1 hypothetical protein [Moorena sp. SIO3F7]
MVTLRDRVFDSVSHTYEVHRIFSLFPLAFCLNSKIYLNQLKTAIDLVQTD